MAFQRAAVATALAVACAPTAGALKVEGTEGLPMKATKGSKNVAIIMGSTGNHPVGLIHGMRFRSHYIKEFQEHILDPLLKDYQVSMFATANLDEMADWNAYILKLNGLAHKQVTLGAKLPNRQNTRFSDELCHHSHCEEYWQTYGPLRNSFVEMQHFETRQHTRFDYVVKARPDFEYKPDNYVQNWWLAQVPQDAVLVPSTEFHNLNRWFESMPSLWPDGMTDQFIFGGRVAMDRFFSLMDSKVPLPDDNKGQGIESIVARYLQDHNVKVATVELQFAAPGSGHHFNGREGKWVESKCVYCMRKILSPEEIAAQKKALKAEEDAIRYREEHPTAEDLREAAEEHEMMRTDLVDLHSYHPQRQSEFA